MKDKPIFCLFLLIFLVIFWKINYGYEPGDCFFSLNQFIFFDKAPYSINIPLFLTNYIGNGLVKLANLLDLPPALFLRIVTACIRLMAAVVIYRTLSRDLGKYLVALGMLCGFLFEKSAFPNFHYSFVSLYGFVFMLCSLLAGLKHNSKFYYCLSGALYALCAFSRCSNIVYGAAYILVFLYGNSSWKHTAKQAWQTILYISAGFIPATLIIIGIISCNFGLDEYGQIVENVQASSVDGHGVFSLICSAACFLTQGFAMLISVFCIVSLYSFLLKYVQSKLVPFLLLSCLCVAFFSYLWVDPYVFNLFPYKRLAFIIFLYINAIASFLIFAFLCTLVKDTSLTIHQKRILSAAAVFVLVAHFGSLCSTGLLLLCMSFIMPVCFFTWMSASNAERLSKNQAFAKAWRQIGGGVTGLLAAMALFLALTFTVCEINRPGPGSSVWKYQSSNEIPLLKGIMLTPSEKSYYEQVHKELSQYANPNGKLISLIHPADNAILGMAPFFKWQGGWTWLTYPHDMKKQLSNAKERPYIILSAISEPSYPRGDQHKAILMDYVANNRYQLVKTQHFYFYMPMP